MPDGLETGLERGRDFHVTRLEKELDGVEPLSDNGAVAQRVLKPPPVNQ